MTETSEPTTSIDPAFRAASLAVQATWSPKGDDVAVTRSSEYANYVVEVVERAFLVNGWRPPSTEGATESQWEAAYYQKLADFARETLRTSELIRERDDLRRQLAERDEETAEERYAEGDQVEIYTVGRWEPADVCRDYGGDRIEARDWGRVMHTCRREDVRPREVSRG
jgi:predicted HNH restriction endonuclease